MKLVMKTKKIYYGSGLINRGTRYILHIKSMIYNLNDQSQKVRMLKEIFRTFNDTV